MISKNSQIEEKKYTYEFGEYSFSSQNKVLFRGEETIILPPKACELLGLLVENHGQVISREDLFKQVWTETFVEEANLTHHISALRKALGEDNNGKKFIETIPRKGYRFVSSVKKFREPENRPTEVTVSERVTRKLTEEAEISYQPFMKLSATKESANGWVMQNKLLFAAGLLLVISLAWAFYGFAWRSGAMSWTQDKIANQDGKIPHLIKQCEEGICGTWTHVDGNQFIAVWDNDVQATLTVEQFDDNQVVIIRKDISASTSHNFSARYVGKLSGNKITNGKVTWTYNGRSWSGTWSANW